jgi:hypothetical protein
MVKSADPMKQKQTLSVAASTTTDNGKNHHMVTGTSDGFNTGTLYIMLLFGCSLYRVVFRDARICTRTYFITFSRSDQMGFIVE